MFTLIFHSCQILDRVLSFKLYWFSVSGMSNRDLLKIPSDIPETEAVSILTSFQFLFISMTSVLGRHIKIPSSKCYRELFDERYPKATAINSDVNVFFFFHEVPHRPPSASNTCALKQNRDFCMFSCFFQETWCFAKLPFTHFPSSCHHVPLLLQEHLTRSRSTFMFQHAK